MCIFLWCSSMCLGYLHKSQKRVLGSSYSFEGGSLPESGICIFLKKLCWKSASIRDPTVSVPHWREGLQAHRASGLFRGWWDMNSGPHHDTASILSHKAIFPSLFCLFLLRVLSQRPLLLVECVSNWILVLISCPRCRHITAAQPSLYGKTAEPPKDGLHCSKWSFSGYLSSLGFVWMQLFFPRGLCWRLQLWS